VDISVTVCSFVCLCLFVLCTTTDFSMNFAPQKAKIGRIGDRVGHTQPDINISVVMCRLKFHTRDAPFVEYCVAYERRISMCGYTAVHKDRDASIYLKARTEINRSKNVYALVKRDQTMLLLNFPD